MCVNLQNQDESQAASQEILKYLPIMFGFFALNVPSGLGVYWVINSLVSTAATVLFGTAAYRAFMLKS